MAQQIIKKFKRFAKDTISQVLKNKQVEFQGLTIQGAFQDFGLLNELSKGQREPLMTQMFLSDLRPGVTFWDIGAHVGVYSLLAARTQDSQVLAIEPNPRTFAYLKSNIANNRLDSAIQALPLGIAESSGTLTFYCDELESDVSSLIALENPGKLTAIDVEVLSLDDLMRTHPNLPQLIKIDVEGAELCVLLGGTQFWKKVKEQGTLSLFIESNSSALRRAGTSPAELIGALQAVGLSVSIIDEAAKTKVPVDNRIETGCWNLHCSFGQT